MVSKFFIGFIGMMLFALGALIFGHAIDNLNMRETIGFAVMFIGIYLIGCFIASRE